MLIESEWKDYEYAHDLNYYYGSGPGNPYSATTGYPWVKALTDIFSGTSGAGYQPPSLIMGFTVSALDMITPFNLGF
jgi:acid phosphatase